MNALSLHENYCAKGLRTFHLYHLSFGYTLNASLSSNFLWDTWVNPSSHEWNQIEHSKQLFFSLWAQKALIFLMSWAPSAVAYHSESDTFIINYIQAVWWHPNLAWGKQWVVRGGLCCLAAQGAILITTHVPFESISITHWPFSPFGKRDDGDDWLLRWSLSVALRRFYQEIQDCLHHITIG